MGKIPFSKYLHKRLGGAVQLPNKRFDKTLLRDEEEERTLFRCLTTQTREPSECQDNFAGGFIDFTYTVGSRLLSPATETSNFSMSGNKRLQAVHTRRRPSAFTKKSDRRFDERRGRGREGA